MVAGLRLAKEITLKSGPKLADFKDVLQTDSSILEKITKIKTKVEDFARKFPIPGFPLY